MAKKKSVTIYRRITVKCPFCGKNQRVDAPEDRLLTSLECNKCKQKISTPIMKCCIICAFSKKRCPQGLLMEAKIKHLEIRYVQPKNTEKRTEG